MSTRNANKIVLLPLASVALLTFAGWYAYVRPLPFNAARWRSGDRVLRYRMKDALRAEHDAGRLATLRAVDSALGPDDESRATSDVRTFSLSAPIDGNPWYVAIRFDETGNVVSFTVAAN